MPRTQQRNAPLTIAQTEPGQIVHLTEFRQVSAASAVPQGQPQTTSKFPVLPIIAGCIVIGLVALAIPQAISEMNSAKVSRLQAENALLETQLERAEADQTELQRVRECLNP